ncbi:MAG: BON domain-containing protein [Terracidiphilus sp.]
MTERMRTTRTALLAAAFAAGFWGLPQASFAAPVFGAQAEAAGPAAADAAARLNHKQYRNLKVTVDNGIATLTGSVDLYEYKADAEKRVRKARGVTAVRNLIEVAGPDVPDSQLQAKLVEELEYDQVGYGNVFDAISVKVQNGVATLGGHALNYPARDSALGLASTCPGVKDVIDEIEVDPASFMDDRIRMAVAQAIYGYGALNKYAIDPAKTIRISVQNGHVELYGIVDSQGDKEIAYIRANGVPGVFSVKNYLQVANQPSETQK